MPQEILVKSLLNKTKRRDPYLQIEEKQQLTRKILELILRYRFPVHVITKSHLVTRDFDLLSQINDLAIVPRDLPLQHKAIISFSFSTLDDSTAKIFEPGATLPSKRLATVQQTLAAGFHCGIRKTFFYGFQTPSWYRTMLAKRTKALAEKYDVSDSIL